MRACCIKILSVSLIIGITMACKEQVEPVPYTYTKVFTGQHSKTWQIKFFEQTLNGTITDTFGVSCTSDDEMTFYANSEREYKVDTGTKKCNDPKEDDEIIDSWAFNNGSATLTIILPVFDPTTPIPFIVREATADNLVLEVFLDTEGKESYRIHLDSIKED